MELPDNDRGRPPAGAPSNVCSTDTSRIQRQEWASRLIAAGRPFPRYGSPEWISLPDGSPAKVAAVVVAAESWARESDELEQRLRAEIEMSRVAFKADEDADYIARRDAHKASWTGAGFRPIPGQRAAIESEWREWVDA